MMGYPAFVREFELANLVKNRSYGTFPRKRGLLSQLAIIMGDERIFRALYEFQKAKNRKRRARLRRRIDVSSD